MDNKLVNESIDEILENDIEITEDSEVSYEVWALGYDEDIIDVELLLGTFEDPDDAVQYASIIKLADIEEYIREEHLDEYLFDGLDCLSIEVETVVDSDDTMMNVGTIYTRSIQLEPNEDISITKNDYEVLETGEIKISKKLLKDFNKNDVIKVMFADEEGKPVLPHKIMSTVIYQDGEYYHLEFMC